MSGEKSGFVENWQSGKSLAACNLHMLTSEDSCDVTFLVGEGESVVSAHRYVLMSRSCVFHAMLRGPLAETGEVKVTDVTEDVFRLFLRFLYTDEVDVTSDNVIALLYLGKKYAVGSLEKLCLTNLETSLSADSACTILEESHRFDEEDLMRKALDVIVENSDTALKSAEFSDLSHACMEKVIMSEDLQSTPEVIFSAALSWASEECKRQEREITPTNQRNVLGDAIFHIGFPSMDSTTFADVVVPSRVLTGDESTMIFCYFLNQEVDVAPFRSRHDSLPDQSLLFYKDRVKVRMRWKETISVICDRDVKLKGLLVHSDKQGQGGHYSVISWKYNCGYGTELNNRVLSTSLKKHHLDEIAFPAPMKLAAGKRFCFKVVPHTNGSGYAGSTLKGGLQARQGNQIINVTIGHFDVNHGLFAGLIFDRN